MNERNWKRDYEGVLHEKPSASRRAERERADLRNHPRLQPQGLHVTVGVTPGLHLIELTDDEVQMYSDHRFQPGQRVQIEIETAPPLEVEVVSCRMEETDPDLLEVRYRVHCRILPAAAP